MLQCCILKMGVEVNHKVGNEWNEMNVRKELWLVVLHQHALSLCRVVYNVLSSTRNGLDVMKWYDVILGEKKKKSCWYSDAMEIAWKCGQDFQVDEWWSSNEEKSRTSEEIFQMKIWTSKYQINTKKLIIRKVSKHFATWKIWIKYRIDENDTY